MCFSGSVGSTPSDAGVIENTKETFYLSMYSHIFICYLVLGIVTDHSTRKSAAATSWATLCDQQQGIDNEHRSTNKMDIPQLYNTSWGRLDGTKNLTSAITILQTRWIYHSFTIPAAEDWMERKT